MYIVTSDTGRVTHDEILDDWDMVKAYVSGILEPRYLSLQGGGRKLIGIMTKDGEKYFGVIRQDVEDGAVILYGDETTIRIKEVHE